MTKNHRYNMNTRGENLHIRARSRIWLGRGSHPPKMTKNHRYNINRKKETQNPREVRGFCRACGGFSAENDEVSSL